MYSSVFWFEISDLVVFLAVIIQKNSRRSGPCLFKGGCGPKTHRIADFFDQRQTSIIATPQQTFKSDACRCKMGLTGLHDSPARVQNSLFIVWLS